MHVVRPSVRPSVTLVDQDHAHRLEVLETNCTVNYTITFALRSPKAIHLFPGEHGKILARLHVGRKKVPYWSTKAAISLKRLKIEEKLLPNALSNGTIPDPLGPPLPQDWGFATPPKTSIAIISGTAKATDCKFSRYIRRVHPTTSPWKIWEKRERGRIQGRPKFFWVLPIISGTRILSYELVYSQVPSEQNPLKIWEKMERGRIQELPIFSVTPIISGTVKLWTSNFVRTFLVSIGTKARYKFREK